MKAVQLPAYGGADRLQVIDLPVPQPGAGEVLIRIKASAVNPFDLLVREGLFADLIPLSLPAVLGGDAAGIIEAIGEGVSDYKPGDRVVADFPTNGRGSHAEYGVVPTTAMAPLPDSMNFEDGAALPKAGLTGYQSVQAIGAVSGERVLVAGALGSVGRAALHYLQVTGAVPVAGVRPDRMEEARALGVEAVDLSNPKNRASFKRAIATAGAAMEETLGLLEDGGRLVSIVPVLENLNPNGRIEIVSIYHTTDALTLAAVARAAADGTLVIPVAEVYPLEELGAAQNAVAKGVRGKVILRH